MTLLLLLINHHHLLLGHPPARKSALSHPPVDWMAFEPTLNYLSNGELWKYKITFDLCNVYYDKFHQLHAMDNNSIRIMYYTKEEMSTAPLRENFIIIIIPFQQYCRSLYAGGIEINSPLLLMWNFLPVVKTRSIFNEASQRDVRH